MQGHWRALQYKCSLARRSDPAAGAAEGFTITPFAAGHLVGGCAWRITTPEDEDIVYAVHYNHRKQASCTLHWNTCMSMLFT